jgi:hypothetical protein
MTSKLINNMGKKNNRGAKTAKKTETEEDEEVPSSVEESTEVFAKIDD